MSRKQTTQHPRCRLAFTLIELLVVVAIITLLISILLPSLKRAKEQSRTVVCRANIRQVAMAFLLYGQDYGAIPGTYWQGEIDTDWSGRNNRKYLAHPDRYHHPIETSVLWRYMNHEDRILACPTAHREANTFYDYTVPIRIHGARIDLPWKMLYPPDPRRPRENRQFFRGIILLLEEDRIFYNELYDDGSWAWFDQFSHRHFGECNIGYLDGSVDTFQAPQGINPDVEERADLKARNVKIEINGKVYPIHDASRDRFGWINRVH